MTNLKNAAEKHLAALALAWTAIDIATIADQRSRLLTRG